jgi:DNA-binding winged helix-turn-helix (wHTH) protein/tetratricopeptide (TPR) repeat protein
VAFGPFRLDSDGAELRRGKRVISLRPDTLAILQYLVERRGQLVETRELIGAVWPDTVIADATLKARVGELRRALADTAGAASYIETVPRRGYRFVADVVVRRAPSPARGRAAAAPQAALVGRGHELAVLQAAWRRALAGRRQVVFASGEAGIGKTALVEAFLAAQDRSLAAAWIARGQCVEQYGTGEPFLPILEGIGRLCRAPGGSRIVSLFGRHAPSWLVQIPGLTGAAEQAALARRYAGSGRERMLDEMVAGLEALTAHAPLVLVLEDLHWSDRSTLTLLAALARRSEPARLFVLATFRPADTPTIEHPLQATVQELIACREASELALAPLDEASVGAYLTQRFAGGLDRPLAPILCRQTGGNPLFMVNTVDHLVACELIAAAGAGWALRATPAEIERAVPESLRCTIDRHVQRLHPATWRLLEGASVAGVDFTARTVAAALGVPAASIEEDIAVLARSSRVLQLLGRTRWPDGSETTCARFVHALYQDVVYGGLTPTQRRDMHRRIGQAIATGWAAQPGEVATILAMHFERAADHAQAARYRQLAGDAAARRHAYEESIDHYQAALASLDTLPPGRARDGAELELRVALGLSLTSTKGFGAPDVEATYTRALELCSHLGEPPQLFPVIEGLHSFYTMRGELPVGYSLAQRMHRIAESVGDRALRCEAHHTMGCVELRMGQLRSSRTHLERAIALSDVAARATAYTYSGHDPTVCCLGYLGMNLWYSGHPDQGLRRATEGLEWAAAVEHPVSTVLAHTLMTWVRVLRGEDAAAAEQVDAMLALSAAHGLIYWTAIARMFGGWIAARAGRAEGLEELRAGFAICQAIGPGVARVDFLVAYADASLHLGAARDGVRAADEALALVACQEERGVEAELHRLRGELLLQDGAGADAPPPPDALASLETALAIARQQGARGFELRAALGLSRCWSRLGRQAHARRLLGCVYEGFEEGAETADMQAARTFLGGR